MNNLGIVIIGYKNRKGIERLLKSLDEVDFEGQKNITLIISIDYSGDNSVEELAYAYEWKNGNKHVIAHKVNLGLQKHILSCGNYMEEYNLSAIAVLEDDIYVSPEMYKYMKGAIDFYKNDPKIAGISLYKHEININAKSPFTDYCDGGDTYFMQYAMSWGQIWMRDQWRKFRQWYDEQRWNEIDVKRIPKNILKWKNSWLKYHIMYCIDQDLFFVYPRVALSTNFSDVGAHNKSITTSMQVSMCMKKTNWFFSSFVQTRAVYDAFFENIKIIDFLGMIDLEVDLYGVKEYKKETRYVLTRKCLPNKVVKAWGLFLRPVEANVYMDIPGNDIFLYDLSVSDKAISSLKQRERIFEYELKGLNILCIENILFCIRKVVWYVKYKICKARKK